MGEYQDVKGDIGVAAPSRVYHEDQMDLGVANALAVMPTECGNSACPTGCMDVAVLIVSNGIVYSYRYGPDVARKLGEAIIATCDQQEAKAAHRAGRIN